MKRVWRQRWFMLAVIVFLFLAATRVNVALAGTDVQLDKILKAGVDGFVAYLDWLLTVLQEIW